MNAVQKIDAARLPMPAGVDVDPAQWKVLVEAIWPGAKTVEGVKMAIDYCRVRGLDPFKRPVHIVPMWNSALRREVETVWPGINELQTTAARTGEWAGMDEPRWGPMTTETFSGTVGRGNDERNVEATVTFPEWCSVTVWRFVHGQRCAFAEPVFWIEAYARIGKSPVPNDMWQKRVRGQLHKVAKAASLRAAFPEQTGNDYTSDEMEGQTVDAGGVTIDHEPSTMSEESARSAEASVAPQIAQKRAEKKANSAAKKEDVGREQAGAIASLAGWHAFLTEGEKRLTAAPNARAVEELIARATSHMEKEGAPKEVVERTHALFAKAEARFAPPDEPGNLHGQDGEVPPLDDGWGDGGVAPSDAEMPE